MAPTATLPWYQIGALICLTRGTIVPAGDAPSAQSHLPTRLLGLSLTKLVQACAANQATSTPEGMYAHVQAIGAVGGKPYYSWTAATGFPLRLRTGLAEPFLGPAAIVLPWPLEASEGILIASTFATAGGISASLDPPVDTPDTGLLLDAFMRAADDGVSPTSPARPAFETAWRAGRAKAWIVDRAKAEYGYTGTYPPGLTVDVVEAWKTTQTRWEVQDGQLHLACGWQPQTIGEGGSGLVVFDEWPCGAFEGY